MSFAQGAMKTWFSNMLSFGTLLCAIGILVWGYAFVMRALVYNLPPAGPYPYPIQILGAIMMSVLGWYNVERGSSRLAFWVGSVMLYLTIGAGLLMILDLP
jgi:hypothetical protein